MRKCALAFAIASALAATGAAAQQAMSSEEIKGLVTGKSLQIGSDGVATYKADGKYEYYVKSNGQTARGKWSVQGDRICVVFDAGGNRCDQFLRDAGKTLLKNSRGTTFVVSAQ